MGDLASDLYFVRGRWSMEEQSRRTDIIKHYFGWRKISLIFARATEAPELCQVLWRRLRKAESQIFQEGSKLSLNYNREKEDNLSLEIKVGGNLSRDIR